MRLPEWATLGAQGGGESERTQGLPCQDKGGGGGELWHRHVDQLWVSEYRRLAARAIAGGPACARGAVTNSRLLVQLKGSVSDTASPRRLRGVSASPGRLRGGGAPKAPGCSVGPN